MKQRKRSEIKEEDTWDLTYIFKDEDEFKKCFENTKEEIKEISSYKGKILKDSDTLLSYLEYDDDIERKLYKLYYYAHLSLDVDTTNTTSQEREGKVSNLLQEYSVLSSFVLPELLKGDYNTVKKYLDEDKNLEKYRFNLENVYRYQEHSLNEESEKMLSQLSKSFIADETFEALTDADITFPNIKVNGEEIELTESNYNSFIRSNNRDVRKDAFSKLLGTYENFKNTLAKTFSGNVELLTSMAKIKKFNSSIEASLYGDNIPVSVYNKLINYNFLFFAYTVSTTCSGNISYILYKNLFVLKFIFSCLVLVFIIYISLSYSSISLNFLIGCFNPNLFFCPLSFKE